MCRRIAEYHSRASGWRLITNRRGGDYDPAIAAAVNDPKLTTVTKTWGRMPEAIGAGIVAMVNAAGSRIEG